MEPKPEPKPEGCLDAAKGLGIIGLFLFVFFKFCCPSPDTSSPSEAYTPSVPTKPLAPLTEQQLDSIEKKQIADFEEEVRAFDVSNFSSSTAEVITGGYRLEGFGQLVEEWKNSSDPDKKKAAQRLRPVVASVMSKNYPKLRKQWVALAKEKMWENDIEVSVGGTGNSTLTFVGGAFAANKNIKASQEAISDGLTALRFKRVNYKWYSGADEYDYYSMKTKGDSEF